MDPNITFAQHFGPPSHSYFHLSPVRPPRFFNSSVNIADFECDCGNNCNAGFSSNSGTSGNSGYSINNTNTTNTTNSAYSSYSGSRGVSSHSVTGGNSGNRGSSGSGSNSGNSGNSDMSGHSDNNRHGGNSSNNNNNSGVNKMPPRPRKLKLKPKPRLQPQPKNNVSAKHPQARGKPKPKLVPAPRPRSKQSAYPEGMYRFLGQLHLEIADVGARRDAEEGNVATLVEARAVVKECFEEADNWIVFAFDMAQNYLLAGQNADAAAATASARAMNSFAHHYYRRMQGHDFLLTCSTSRAGVYGAYVTAAEELADAIETRDAPEPVTFWATRLRGIALQVPLELCPAFWKLRAAQRALNQTVMETVVDEQRGNVAMDCPPPYAAARILAATSSNF